MPSNIRNFLISFLLASVFFSFTAYYAVQALRVIMFESDDTPVEELPSELPAETSDDVDSGDIISGGSMLNILLIGTDYQPEIFSDYTVPGNSLANERQKIAETILFVSFNTRSKSLIICPIPAKTQVKVDGTNMTLGQSFNYKNSVFIVEKVSQMTGVSINYYATVTMQGLATIIDRLGGMQFNVPCDMSYEDLSQNLVIDLKEGRQNLSGDQVLQLLRYNGYDDADNTGSARTALQGEVAYALLQQKANYTNKLAAAELFLELSKYMDTNLTIADVSTYLSVVFGYGGLNYVPIEYPGAYTARYFTPNTDSAKEIFSNYFS